MYPLTSLKTSAGGHIPMELYPRIENILERKDLNIKYKHNFFIIP